MCRNNKNQQYNEEFMKRRVQKSRTALFLSLLWSAPTKLCNCRHLKHPVFYTITLFSFILHIFAMKTFNKRSTNKGRREDEMIIIWILKPWHYFAYYLNAYYLVCDKRYLFFNFFFFSFERKVHERYIEIELIPYLRFVWKSIFQCSWLFHDEKTSFFALVGRREIGLDRMSWYGKNSRS